MATHSVFHEQRSLQAIVHGVAKSRSQLNDFHFHFILMILSCALWGQAALSSNSDSTVN